MVSSPAVTFPAVTQVTESLQSGMCPLRVNDRVCALYSHSSWWSVGLGNYFGLQKGRFPSSGFPPWVQGSTAQHVPPQAATVPRFDGWASQPSTGQAAKPQSGCLVHKGPAGCSGCAGNHPLHWRGSCKPCCLHRSVHMGENTTLVGASLWNHSFRRARNPMPPHTFSSIHSRHPAGCHCLQFPF